MIPPSLTTTLHRFGGSFPVVTIAGTRQKRITVTKDYIRARKNAAKFSVENSLQPWPIHGGDESYERSGVHAVGWRDISDWVTRHDN